MFISPDWADDDDTTMIEQLTSRYTPEQCMMAETDAGYETMLRTRADGQENPGMKLLEEYNIRVSEIVDGDRLDQHQPENNGRQVQGTENHRNAGNRQAGHQPAPGSRHKQDARGPTAPEAPARGPGLRDKGILGADRGRQRPQAPGLDQQLTLHWNHRDGRVRRDNNPRTGRVERLLQRREPPLHGGADTLPEPEGQGETEETQETEETYTWRRKRNRLSAIVQGHTIRVKAATWGEFQEAIKNITGPKAVPVTTQYNNKMLNLMGLAVPNQPTSSAPGCICTGARNGIATILSFTPSPLGMGPGTETIEFFQEAMTPPGIHPDAPRPAGNRAGAARIAERWLDQAIFEENSNGGKGGAPEARESRAKLIPMGRPQVPVKSPAVVAVSDGRPASKSPRRPATDHPWRRAPVGRTR